MEVKIKKDKRRLCRPRYGFTDTQKRHNRLTRPCPASGIRPSRNRFAVRARRERYLPCTSISGAARPGPPRKKLMPRAPFNVAVHPYRKAGNGEFQYAVLKRSDAEFWQGVAGGGQDSETPLEAARRETFEETGISPESEFLRLDTVEPIPVVSFRDSHLWGEDLYVIPQYWFGVPARTESLTLSDEHIEYRWLSYEEACNIVKFDGNRTALWELNQRLKGLGPRG